MSEEHMTEAKLEEGGEEEAEGEGEADGGERA